MMCSDRRCGNGWFAFAGYACAVAILIIGPLSRAAAASPTPGPVRVAPGYGTFALGFEANQGQADGAVRFLFRSPRYTLLVTPTEELIHLGGGRAKSAVVRMRLAGADPGAPWVGEEPLAARSNYFIGSDPRRWRTGIAHYARVRASGVWQGVDLVLRESRRQVEYDLVLAPGADPERIRLAFDGVEAVSLDERGGLVLRTAAGDLVQSAPTVYQQVGAERRRVEGRWTLRTATEAGFAVGAYDRTRPLVIDPTLAYSTYLGGSGIDAAAAIAVDRAGNSYLTGTTASTGFTGVGAGSIQPSLSGSEDVFVTKVNAAGTAIVYSTYLGGAGEQQGMGIAVDASGNAYVTGFTSSTGFPGTGTSPIQSVLAGGSDGFVTKISAAGDAIVYSTYLGGSGLDQANAIAVDTAGNAYVAGLTASGDFRSVTAASLQRTFGGGVQDAFVTKINAAGTAIVYSTFLGGNDLDAANAIAVDAAGNAYVTGDTLSPTFPGVTTASLQATAGGLLDVFVTKIDAAGTAIVFSTFLGGEGDDIGLGIALDAADNAYVAGQTSSSSFKAGGGHSSMPLFEGTDAGFVAKINAAGTSLGYLTYLGGSSGKDIARAIAVDPVGSAYVTGSTESTDFPGVAGSSIQPALAGTVNAFLAQLNPTGTTVVYSTYLGGSGFDIGHGIALGGDGNVYLAGSSSSPDFPGAAASPIKSSNTSIEDAFLAKISMGMGFFTLPPCRVLDTRGAAGPLGGPSLQPAAQRTFAVARTCGIPATARVLSVNLTITQAGATGDLRLFPAGTPLPQPVQINFVPGLTRANNAMVLLGAAGFTVQVDSKATVQFILDVNGYFQ